MPLYRVLEGHRHGALDQYGPGDVVEMTEREAAPLLGYKLALVEESPDSAEEPETKPSTMDLPIEDILALVRAGDLDVGGILTAERAGKRRVTLIRALEEMIDDEANP